MQGNQQLPCLSVSAWSMVSFDLHHKQMQNKNHLFFSSVILSFLGCVSLPWSWQSRNQRAESQYAKLNRNAVHCPLLKYRWFKGSVFKLKCWNVLSWIYLVLLVQVHYCTCAKAPLKDMVHLHKSANTAIHNLSICNSDSQRNSKTCLWAKVWLLGIH